MGLTQKLGTIPLAILTDSSNNVGIGAAANASFKLQVTGTTNLTGALSGTSATFSGNVRLNAASSGTNKLIFGLASTDYYWLEYNDATGNIGYFSKYNQIFYGGAAGTTPLMTILNGGNVGIGTSSPSGAAGLALVLNSGASQGRICIKTSSTGDASGDGLQIGMSGVDAFIEQRENADLSFATNASERMRITSGGNVLIGTTSDNGDKFQVNGNGSATTFGIGRASEGNCILSIKGISTSSANYSIITRDSAGNDLLVIRNDGYGYLKAAAWAYGSDKRIKENINYIETGLNKILALKPATFDYIEGVKNNIGWIAQDVQEVIPEAVGTISETNDQLTLKSDFIVPYLVKAIQEQQAQIEELKAKIK